MLTKIKRWLEPPHFDGDEEKTDQARVLNTLLINLGIVLLLAIFVLVPFFVIRKIGVGIMLSVFLGALIVGRTLIFRGQFPVAKVLVIAIAWFCFFILTVASGGSTSPAMVYLALVTLISGFILGLRAANGLTVFTILAALGITLLENQGLELPKIFVFTPLIGWLIFGLSLLFMNSAGHLFVRNLENALGRAREQNKARQFAESTLRESEARFRSLTENSTDFTAIVDKEGIFQYVSASHKLGWGYTLEELLGKNAFDFIHPDDIPNTLTEFTKAQQVEDTIKAVEFRFRHKDGTWRFVEAIGRNLLHDPSISGIIINSRDITERKRVEEALRASEEKYRSIVETTIEWVWEIDLDGRHTFSNPGVTRILGYPLEEFMGQTVNSLLHAEDLAEVERILPQLVAEKRGWKGWILRWRHADGSYRFLEGDAEPVFDAMGNLRGFRGVDRDITARKQVEEAQRESQRHYQALVEGTPGIVYSFSNQRGGFYYSPRVQSVLGYSPDFLYAHPMLWHDSIHPDDVSLVDRSIRQATSGQVFRIEYRIRDAQGNWHWLDDRSMERQGVGSEVIIHGLALDITEHKHAEEALRIKDSALESSINAIAISDLAGNLTYVNPTFLNLWGYTDASQVLGRNATAFWHVQNQAAKIMAALQTERGWIGELNAQRRDGSTFPAQISASMILDQTNQPLAMFAAFTDITERKRTEKQLVKLNECLLSFGTDPLENINRLTALGGELLEADCALYNRLDEGMLCSWGQWHSPPGYNPQDKPEGHICYDVIKQGSEQPFIVRHLAETLYAKSDPNVVPYQLQTYVGQAVKFENKFVGSLCMVYQRDFMPTEDQQHLVGIIASAIGVEEKRRHAEDALRESEERYTLAVNGANDGLWDWDLLEDEIYYSPRWKAMLGYAENQSTNAPNTWFDAIHPEDVVRVREEISAHLRGDTSCWQSEHRMRYTNGSYFWVLARGLAVRNEKGIAYRMAGSLSDITARKHAEAQLIHDAFHDELTGLPNRALFIDRLEHALERTHRRSALQFAVLYLDLDHFKLVNDSLGHAVGDQLLRTSAQRLKSCVRTIDTVARSGGDEFVVLLDDLENTEDVIHTAERIQNELSLPVEVNGQRMFNSASIGIVLNSTRYDKPEEILRDADIAMYHAKSSGRACYAVFDNTMRAATMARLEIETDLRRALERQEFRVHYQPIVSLIDNHLVGFEALVRWQHPRRGLVPPAEFIPVAEETGLIIPLGHWIIHEACRQVREWQMRFATQPPMAVHVNLSAKQFNDSNLTITIEQALQETGLASRSLSLEITESVLMENNRVAATVLDGLRMRGVHIELDDFGTGYSSLSYLNQFPIDVLKVDRMFINQVRPDGTSPEIVGTIIKLGHDLGMKVVAEGLETAVQLEQLKKLGCDYGQGFYFAKPLEANRVVALLNKVLSNVPTLGINPGISASPSEGVLGGE